METLAGHTSPETAFVVDDYPYGFRLRCKIRYWLETKKGHGQRFMSQTTNPKRAEEFWNKPKAGTYHVIAVMVRDESNGHVSIETLHSGGWDDEAKIADFETRHAVAIGEYERKAIKYIRATNEANKLVKYTIRVEGEGSSDEPAQTREEQAAIWNSALRAGYVKLATGE